MVAKPTERRHKDDVTEYGEKYSLDVGISETRTFRYVGIAETNDVRIPKTTNGNKLLDVFKVVREPEDSSNDGGPYDSIYDCKTCPD